jgi:lysozyme family protein
MALLTDALRSQYQQMFDTCSIKQSKYPIVDRAVQLITSGKEKYQQISNTTSIPWYFIGAIHNMESDCSFDRHLHNGDPLSARTVHVPKGRPKTGNPPFSFYDSAIDALTYQGFTEWKEWSVSGMLYCFERYNGFGYRTQGINTPYLWGGSNHYSKGKFVADGKFDPNAISTQIGTAVLLRRMSELQIAIAGEKDLLAQVNDCGSLVSFDGNNYNRQAEKLQKLLNQMGQHLRVDGKAGRNTSDAFKRVAGHYLNGDPNGNG